MTSTEMKGHSQTIGRVLRQYEDGTLTRSMAVHTLEQVPKGVVTNIGGASLSARDAINYVKSIRPRKLGAMGAD